MKYDYYIYSFTGNENAQFIRDKIEALPANIKDEAIKDKRLKFFDSIWVDAKKTDIIDFLDEYFEVNNKHYVRKIYNLEVDNKEINQYEYFTIFPKAVQWEKGVKSDLVMPKCPDPCPVGCKPVMPITVYPKKCKNIGINEIGFSLFGDPELLISAELKDLFDRNHITGLQYTQCVFSKKDNDSSEKVLVPYHANIVDSVYENTDELLIRKWYCKKHKILREYDVLNCFLKSHDLTNADIQCVKGVIYNGKTYYYRKPRIIISKRVLQIILDNNISGLNDNNFFVRAKFKPFLIKDF